MSWASAAAYGVASLTHLVTAGLLSGGLLLVVLGFETVVQPMIGLVLLGFAALLRPRVSRLDTDLPTLRRMDAPTLFGLLDEIADAAGVRRFDVVQVSPDFAIRASAYGIRRRRRLEIGLPFWLTLEPQQRVAAVAHEVGHFASGDVRRGLLVDSALGALWAGAGSSGRRPSTVEPMLRAASPLSRHADEMAEAARRYDVRSRSADALLWIPKLLGRGAARLLTRLTLPGARRTEFLADAVAARVASTEAADSAVRGREFAGSVTAEVHRRAVALRTFRRGDVARRAEDGFWAEVVAHAAALRDGVGEESSGVPRSSAAIVSPGLPSCDERIARLALDPAQPAAVTLDGATAGAIEDELREPKSRLARKVVQDCLHS